VSSIEDAHALQAIRKSSRCIAGQHWAWDGVDFAVLHPEAVDYDAPPKPNAMSCVLRISNGQRTALLVGDLESPQEARLVDAAAPLRADVLLVPHHGSKTSSSGAFLDAVHPAFALVQAGYRNRFGHPASPVIDRYRERSIAVVDSPHCGAARWSSAQPQRVDCERDMRPHYWLHRAP
jgi:competence protein ComEC